MNSSSSPTLFKMIQYQLFIYYRKLSYKIFNKALKVSKFEYTVLNPKGLLIVEYWSKGLVYAEIFNQKFLKKDDILIFNLSNIELSDPIIQIALHGGSEKIIVPISIEDTINTNFRNFRTRINLNLTKFNV